MLEKYVYLARTKKSFVTQWVQMRRRAFILITLDFLISMLPEVIDKSFACA